MIFYASFTLLTLVLAFVDARGPFYTVEVLSSDPSIELRGKWDPLAPLGGGHARYLSTSVLDASAITSLPLGAHALVLSYQAGEGGANVEVCLDRCNSSTIVQTASNGASVLSIGRERFATVLDPTVPHLITLKLASAGTFRFISLTYTTQQPPEESTETLIVTGITSPATTYDADNKGGLIGGIIGALVSLFVILALAYTTVRRHDLHRFLTRLGEGESAEGMALRRKFARLSGTASSTLARTIKGEEEMRSPRTTTRSVSVASRMKEKRESRRISTRPPSPTSKPNSPSRLRHELASTDQAGATA